MNGLSDRGWRLFAPDDRTAAWANAARRVATGVVSDPANAHWLRSGGTWFVGVDALANAPDGSIGGVPLDGPALDHLRAARALPDAWHPAQLSVIHPGYPRPGAEESEAAFRFRRDRDAAHLDGLLPVGPDRRRMLREPHGFVLGLPLTEANRHASPMVVWEGSHHLIHAAFSRVFAAHPESAWPEIDLTGIYQATRRKIFETCERRILHVPPGGAYLVHRMALHGVAPWSNKAAAAPEGRMIAYFRPQIPMNQWILSP